MRGEYNDDPQTFCEKCQNFIRTANYLIHEVRCKGSGNSESRVSRQGNRPSSRIFSSRASSRSHVIQQPEQEKIPCPFCGYQQSLSQLDSHPNQCMHRQTDCEGCDGKYPISLIEQHNVVCPGRRRSLPNIFPPRMENRARQRVFDHQQQAEQEPRHPLQQMLMMMQGIHSRRNDLGILINLLAGMGHEQNNGLNQQEMKSFPVKKYEQIGEQPDLCTICYCNFEPKQQVLNLPCKHMYHPDCISKWLQKNEKCPVCKQSVRGEQQRPRRGGGGRGLFIRM